MQFKQTYKQIEERIMKDIRAQFELKTESSFSILKKFGSVLAAGSFSIQSKFNYILKQTNPKTCNEYFLSLWAEIYKVERKLPAYATGEVSIPFNFSANKRYKIPKNTEIVTEEGLKYFIVEDIEKSSANNEVITYDNIKVIAENVGTKYNQPSQKKLYFVKPVAGLDSELITKTGIENGANLEDLEIFRERVLERFAGKFVAGHQDHFLAWTKEYPNITRAWIDRATPAAGFVTINAVMDDNKLNICLDAKTSEKLKEYLQNRAPAGTEVVIRELKEKQITVKIKSNIKRDEILSELQDYIRTQCKPNIEIDMQKIIDEIATKLVLPHGSVKLIEPKNVSVAVFEVPIIRTVIFE